MFRKKKSEYIPIRISLYKITLNQYIPIEVGPFLLDKQNSFSVLDSGELPVKAIGIALDALVPGAGLLHRFTRELSRIFLQM